MGRHAYLAKQAALIARRWMHAAPVLPLTNYRVVCVNVTHPHTIPMEAVFPV
jgi:hypothetical protein